MNILRFVSIYPEIIENYCNYATIKKARQKKIIDIKVVNLRDYGTVNGSVDHKPFGSSEGMLIRADILKNAISHYDLKKNIIITTCPRSEHYCYKHQHVLTKEFLQGKNLIFICARFAGIDQRFVDKYVNYSFSLGNFVVSGGELPCLMIAESLIRTLPEVINKNSLENDSFSAKFNYQAKNYPLFTKPRIFEDMAVDQVLLNGDNKKIKAWQQGFDDKSNLYNSHNLL